MYKIPIENISINAALISKICTESIKKVAPNPKTANPIEKESVNFTVFSSICDAR